MGRRPTPPDVRFWRHVSKSADPDGCWLWTASLRGGAYGQFGVRHGHVVLAHRYSYGLAFGEIPAGLQIDHLCRETRCIRPDHLEAVTARENTLRSNAPSALNAAKDECLRGHPFDDANTYLMPSKSGRPARFCRACGRERSRAYLARKAARPAHAPALAAVE